MGNLRDGGGVGRRGGLGEGRGGRGGFFIGMGDVECEAVVVVSTYPAKDVGPVWLCMLLLLVSCFGVVPGVQRLHFHPCGTCPLFEIPEHVLV